MNLTNIKRIIGLGLTNFWRNGWISFGAILILSLTLMTITSFAMTYLEIEAKVKAVKGKIDIIAYFDDNVGESEIKDIQLKLQSRSDVKRVEYTSKEGAIIKFHSRPGSDKIKNLVTKEDNPLPRSLSINPTNQTAYQEITKLLQGKEFKGKIHKVTGQDNQELVQALNRQIEKDKRNGIFFSAIFIIIAIIVLLNAVKLAVINREKEISIMRLVGASDSFVKLPFLIETSIYAVFASVISVSLIYVGLRYNIPIIPAFISSVFVSTDLNLLQFFTGHIWLIFSLQLLLGLIFSSGFTLFSLRRNLKL